MLRVSYKGHREAALQQVNRPRFYLWAGRSQFKSLQSRGCCVKLSALAAALLAAQLLAVLVGAQQVTVIGIVVDANGSPIAGANIEAYNKDGFLVSTSTTLSNGYFSLALPGTGAYTIAVYKRGYERREISVLFPSTGTTNIGYVTLGYAMQISLDATRIAIDQGSTEAIRLSVTNVGAFTEIVDVSFDAPRGWDVSLVGPQGLVVKSFFVNPGETKVLSVKIRAPGSGEGESTIRMVFRYANVTQQISIVAEVRYKSWELVVPYYTSVSSFAGDRLVIPLKIKNSLDRSCMINVSVTPPEGWMSSIFLNATSFSSIRLEAGESVTAQLVIDVPEIVEPGKYVVTLQAKALDITSYSYVIVQVERSYDSLRVETPTPFVLARPGESVSIPLRILNDGTRAATTRFAVEGLPPGYSWSIKDEYGNVISTAIIPSRSSQRVFLVVSVPSSASPTAVSFSFRAVGLNSTGRIELGISVVGKPSFRILTQSWEVELTAGSSTVFPITISNDGQIPLREISIGTDGNLPSGLQVTVEPNRVVGLQPGESATVTVTVVADSRLEPGRYIVPVIVAAEGSREERTLAVNVRAGGGLLYLAVSLLVLALVVAAYLATSRRGLQRG